MADLRAIHIEFNAPHHTFYVLLVQARDRTVVTRCGAGIAGVNTRLILFMRHIFSPNIVRSNKSLTIQKNKSVLARSNLYAFRLAFPLDMNEPKLVAFERKS